MHIHSFVQQHPSTHWHKIHPYWYVRSDISALSDYSEKHQQSKYSFFITTILRGKINHHLQVLGINFFHTIYIVQCLDSSHTYFLFYFGYRNVLLAVQHWLLCLHYLTSFFSSEIWLWIYRTEIYLDQRSVLGINLFHTI